MPASKQGASEGFLPFLPQEAAGLGDEASEEVVQLLSSSLAELLSESAEGFWRVLQNDASLAKCLDTFLQFSRKPGEAGDDVAGDESLARQDLSRRIFFVLLRMVTQEPGGPTGQGKIIYNRRLLDPAKLMDIAALYGPDNPDLTHRFFSQLFEMEPRYVEDVAKTLPLINQNLHEVLLTTIAAADRARSGDSASVAAVQDGAVYLHDSFRTLAALAGAFPPLADVLLRGEGAALLALLPAVHDELLPKLERLREVGWLVSPLRVILQRVLATLLRGAYLTPADVAASWHQNPNLSPEARGEALMAAIVSAGQSGGNILDGAAAAKSLINLANRRYGLEDAVRAAEAQGVIRLDASQRDYLAAILRSPGKAPTQGLPGRKDAGGSQASGSGRANGNAVAAANGRGGLRVDENLAGLIRQVRDVLPDYGEGFVAACLREFDRDPEQVIHRLLESSLPPNLASLDRAMPLQDAAQPSTSRDQGAPSAEMSWLSLAEGSEATLQRTLRRPEPNQAAPKQPSARVGRGVAKFLEERGTAKEAVRLFASAAQWEYDDDYDDSFDDLAGGTADGLCEAEGDDADAGAGPSGGARGPPGPAGPGPRGPGGRGGPKPTQWVLDGRVYNYRKEGARAVHSAQEAAQAVQESRAASQAIHGLGAGGNKPLERVERAERGERVEREEGDRRPPQQGTEGGGRGGSGGQQGGRGPPSGAGGRGRGSHAHKDKNKAAIGNHHRKDRALRKFAGPPAG